MGKLQGIIFRQVSETDKEQIAKFLSEIFNIKYTTNQWNWKYKEHGLGIYAILAEKDNKVVGHYGAVPRKVLYKGGEYLSGLICDVAVAYNLRGILKKKGIFYNLVHTFKDCYVPEGKYRKLKICYGFPMDRARKVALKLNLYEDIENIYEFIFENNSNITFLVSLFFKYKKFREVPPLLVQYLWQRMKKSFDNIFNKDYIMNIRDEKYLNWRTKQPSAQFKIVTLFKYGRPIALFLIRERENEFLLYDYIGNIKDIGENIKIFLRISPYKKLKARFPEWIKKFFPKDLHFTIKKTNIFLVGNKLTGPKATELKGKFFYTFADEDV